MYVHICIYVHTFCFRVLTCSLSILAGDANTYIQQYMYNYVYMYVCMCVYIYIYIYVSYNIHSCTSVLTCSFVC